jgi:hypothetical protein
MSFRSIGLLALLMLALSPAVARAETSSEKVYHVPLGEIESAPEEAAVHHPHPKPHGSAIPRPGGERTETATAPEEPETRERHHSAPSTPSQGGGHPPGGGSGHKPGPSTSPKEKGPTPTKTDTAENGGGGSSPVVPILIAAFVLAAISIGVVLYRGRRQDGVLDP